MKVLLVSGDDYSALSFEQEFKGTPVKQIIENPSEYEMEDEDNYWNLEVFEAGDVDNRFIDFIRNNILDHDGQKHVNFYTENDIL